MISELAERREERKPWLRAAACRGKPREWWFPVTVPGQHKRHRPENPAFSVCASCPVRPDCDAERRTIPLVCGIWAGRLYNKGVAVDG